MEHTFKVGDLVWLSTENLKIKIPSRKLDFKRVGPFKILEFYNQVSVKLELPENVRINPSFHVSLLTPFRKPLDGQNSLTSTFEIESERHLEPVVEAIVNSRRKQGLLQYLVK